MEGQGTEGNLALNEEDKKEALIKLVRKGAPSVPQKEAREGDLNERVRFSMRITQGLLERINRAVNDRDLKIPINTWLTEAILMQLKKEGF